MALRKHVLMCGAAAFVLAAVGAVILIGAANAGDKPEKQEDGRGSIASQLGF